MATKTHEQADFRGLRRKLDDLRVDPDATGNLLFRAMDNFLTAAGYQDQTLMRSAIEEAKAALADSLTEAVDAQLRYSSKARSEVEDFKCNFDGVPIEPGEPSDELGVPYRSSSVKCCAG